jgi:hypothetical protein
MKKIIIILILYLILFSGCSSIPKPSGGNRTLIIGLILNRTNIEGIIKIQLLEKKTGVRRSYLIKKGNIFFFDNLKGGTYIVEEIIVINNKNENIFQNENAEFTVVNNVVNNIGIIYLEDENKFRNINEHIWVKNEFNKEYSKSGWIKKKWVNYLWNYLQIEKGIKVSKEELRMWIIFSSENKDIDVKVYGLDELNYSEIDEMEKINIMEEELEQFIEEGHLIK